MREVQIAIMAKAPQAGFAKTRLIPDIGARAAARLQRQLTLHTIEVAQQAKVGAVTVWCAPDTQHRFFRSLQEHCQITLRTQVGANLGERMLNVFEQQCAQGPLLMVGTDCPGLTTGHFQTAAQCLTAGDDAVFFPAEDGGYVLIGLHKPYPQVFEGIAWSSDQVMAQTRERLRYLSFRWQEPITLWDVDRVEDLHRLLAACRTCHWVINLRALEPKLATTRVPL